MKSKHIPYHAYLLRLWYEPEIDRWRIVTENVHSGQKQGFNEMESLMTYLKEQSEERMTDS